MNATIETLTGHSYLVHGTPDQRGAYRALSRMRLLDNLTEFTPVLAGTLPLGVNLPGSDLDVLCYASDLNAFESASRAFYGHENGFTSRLSRISGEPTLITTFSAHGYPFELFAQDTPVLHQNGFLHLLTEFRLLARHGDPLRSAVRNLKAAGMKTEPAFCSALGILAEPYGFLRSIAMLPGVAFDEVTAGSARHDRITSG